jgi:hypothetical protein
MKLLGTCNLSGCSCKTERGEEYCSDYCKGAARHAPERDYCQCGHAGCAFPATAGLDAQLTDAISLSPGQVTIQCSSLEHLSEQLRVLSKAVADHSEDMRMRVEPLAARRPAIQEVRASAASAHTA